MTQKPPLPKEFSWRDKNGIQKPPNQGKCGACWAFAASSILSDCFVISGRVDENPHLSPTFILSHYPQSQCQGGAIQQVFDDMKKGVGTDHCVNYDWCYDTASCNPEHRSGGEEFRDKHIVKDLNTLIPKAGCFFPENKYLFTVDKIEKAILKDPLNPREVSSLRLFIKNHIKEVGPVCAGFFVLSNFQVGDFSATKGVYLERVDYRRSKKGAIVEAKDLSVAGGHAVAVVGWGIEKNLEYRPNKTKDIPYWVMRNSWSTKWGDEGYTKVAMYPYNSYICFDVDSQDQGVGGFFMITPGEVAKGDVKQIPLNESELNSLPSSKKKFFQGESSLNVRSKEEVEKHGKLKPSTGISKVYIVILIVAILIIFLFLSSGRRKRMF